MEGTAPVLVVPLPSAHWCMLIKWLYLWQCAGFAHFGQKRWAASGALGRLTGVPLLDSGCRDGWKQGSLIQKVEKKGSEKSRECTRMGVVGSRTVLR